MPVHKVAVSSMVVSWVKIPRGLVLLRGTFRVCAKDRSSKFFPSRALLSKTAPCSSHMAWEEHDTRVNRHLFENFQFQRME